MQTLLKEELLKDEAFKANFSDYTVHRTLGDLSAVSSSVSFEVLGPDKVPKVLKITTNPRNAGGYSLPYSIGVFGDGKVEPFYWYLEEKADTEGIFSFNDIEEEYYALRSMAEAAGWKIDDEHPSQVGYVNRDGKRTLVFIDVDCLC